ncbi:MAG: ribosome biogenesis GTPase Der [Rhodospirillales bacterium]
MPFTVAIVGRPNVGKSTLFNRLAGKRLAIVDDQPGVTRDRREGEGRIADLKFNLFDTAGLEEAEEDALETRMKQQTERAVREADVVLFVVDGRSGLTPMDRHFASWLRKLSANIILVVNKAESSAATAGIADAWQLGLGQPVPMSAEHGIGIDDLYEALLPHRDAVVETEARASGLVLDDSEIDPEEETGPLRLAIVGRPNVGKSTLVNALLGEDRMLTGPEAGVTRDAIASEWTWQGRELRLVDTAGLRRKARVVDRVESLSVESSFRAIRLAQVVLLVLDATQMMEKQDLTIARHVIDEGRALIVVVNKWDAVEDRSAAMRQLTDRLQTSLPQVRGVPIVTLSALTGRGLKDLPQAIFDIYDIWDARVSTGQLNRWLDAMLEGHPPPLAAGRAVKIKYVTQAKSRPPTFILFINRPEDLPESYLRYLANGLRDRFKLDGVQLRLLMRRQKNPYIEEKGDG